jgi:hypothetical protein
MIVQSESQIAKFGHHPDPDIDYCIEADYIIGEWYSLKASHAYETPLRAVVEGRIAEALKVNVVGTQHALGAKTILRKIAEEMRFKPKGVLQ